MPRWPLNKQGSYWQLAFFDRQNAHRFASAIHTYNHIQQPAQDTPACDGYVNAYFLTRHNARIRYDSRKSQETALGDLHTRVFSGLSFWPRHNRRIITQQKAGQWVPGEQEIVFTHRFTATLRCRGDEPPMIFVLHSLATRVHLLINPCPAPALLRAFSTRSLLPCYVHNLISESPTVARYNFSYSSLLPHA